MQTRQYLHFRQVVGIEQPQLQLPLLEFSTIERQSVTVQNGKPLLAPTDLIFNSTLDQPEQGLETLKALVWHHRLRF